MAVKLTSTREAARLHGVKILVYSRSGAGKTYLCSTAPKPLILSAEAGLLSLREFDIPVIQIRSVEDLSEAYQWFITSKEAQQFETVCLDSISEIGEVVLANAKRQVKDPRQAYGELIEKMTTLIRSFRDLPGKNVYFSAKQELNKDDHTGVVTYGPSMPGSKLGQQLPYFFDCVLHLDIGKTEEGKEYRYFRTKTDIRYEAKDRSGALDPMEKPDLTHIFNKIIQKVK